MKDVLPGEARDLVVQELEATVATAVVRERPACAMRLEAVHLDDQSLAFPEEVDLGAAALGERDPGVDQWPGRPDAIADREEGLLELVSRQRRTELALSDHR